METNMHCFEGHGPYETINSTSTVEVLKNTTNGNYIFLLSKKEEFGPVIIDSDFNRGKAKFMKAFELSLIFRSLLSIDEAKEKVKSYFSKEFHVSYDEEVNEIAEEALKERDKMKEVVEKQLILA